MTICFLQLRARKEEREQQFSGKVEKLKINEKGSPTVFVDGSFYFLPFVGSEFANKIEIGDSLIKEGNSKVYILIKKDTKEKISHDTTF